MKSVKTARKNVSQKCSKADAKKNVNDWRMSVQDFKKNGCLVNSD